MSRSLKFIVIFLVVLFSTGCDRIQGLRVMKQNELEDLIYDIHITESTLAVLYPNLTPQELQQEYDKVFQRHNTTQEDFNKAIDYYARHPHKFEQIYLNVYNRIDNLEKDVKDYSYHPEMKHLKIPDTLTQLDIYAFDKAFKMIRPKGENAVFHITDEHVLQAGDRYQWQFTFRAMPYDTIHYDTLHHTCLRFVVEYNNGTMTALTHHIKAKGETNKYTFTIQTPDSLKPISVSGSYFFGTDSVQWIQINNATCYKFFNSTVNPLDDEATAILDSISEKLHRPMSITTRLEYQKERQNGDKSITSMPIMTPSIKTPRLPKNAKDISKNELQKAGGE